MKFLYYKLLKLLLTPLFKAEERAIPKTLNERTVEHAFALECIHNYCKGKILDVGTGLSAFPHLLRYSGYDVTCIDAGDRFNRHYPVIKDNIDYPNITERFQFITCISVIEHLNFPLLSISNMMDLLEPKGYLLLTFPYNPEKTKIMQYDDYFTRVINDNHLYGVMDFLVDARTWKCYTGELWGDGERLPKPTQCKSGYTCDLMGILMQKP